MSLYNRGLSLNVTLARRSIDARRGGGRGGGGEGRGEEEAILFKLHAGDSLATPIS